MSENEERRAGFERKKEKANQLYTHRPLHRPGLLERLLHRVLLALDRLGARVALAAAVGPGEVGLMRRGDASESAAEGDYDEDDMEGSLSLAAIAGGAVYVRSDGKLWKID